MDTSMRNNRSFNEGNTNTNSKENTNHPTIIDTRSISILPAVTKFFELTILHNLEILTSSKLMSKYQRGFTKGKSTIDNIKDLFSKLKLLKKNKVTNQP